MKHTAALSRDTRLFLVSFLILFLEISLIRWISTEIRIFAYVNNLVLLACFLGMGLGCYFSQQPFRLEVTLLALLAILLVVGNPWFRETPMMLSVLSDSLIWFEYAPHHAWFQVFLGIISTLTIFALILLVFFPLGQLLGDLFDGYERIIYAYSVNIAASLVGIWCFNLLSFSYAPPWVWFMVATGCLVAFLDRSAATRVRLAGLVAVLVVMAAYSHLNQQSIVWSPYQKLEVKPLRRHPLSDEHLLTVNNANYMLLLDLSDRTVKQLPQFFDEPMRHFNHYDIPYLFQPQPRDVLIVGAGAGNDTAGALRNGAGQVTAVEIDPGIYRIGRALHPEAPYQDSRVHVVIDDARSFFKKGSQQYDLISFGLLDSHTLGSALTNTRIDNYVYTEESFREARALLKPDGVLTVAFETPRVWVGQRLRDLLHQAFGAEPFVFNSRGAGAYGWGGMLFVVGRDMGRLRARIAQQGTLAAFIDQHRVAPTESVKITTDNWPYLYLEKPRIPSLHLYLSLILLTLFLVFRRFLIPQRQTIQWHFFFLGAAFLLLEFQNISKATLLFGSTWLVNSVIISAILALILVANGVASIWKRMNTTLIYLGLLVSVGIVFALPLSSLNALPYVWRGVVASGLLNLPIFFAGLVFISSFTATKHPNLALGSNLLGAGVGGLLESLSFVLGINMLLVLVALLYLASWLALRHR